MSGSTSGMKQSTADHPSTSALYSPTEAQSGKGGESEKQQAGCGCGTTGSCTCPPNQCTCPNCPREDSAAAKRGIDKQSATKPGEVSAEARKMPSVESAGLDIGTPLTLGGVNISSITQFPSESDRSSIDPSLRGPLNSLLEIRDGLVNKINQGNFNEETLKSCSDHLDHWEGKYRSKEGVYAQSGADFSSTANQIPKGQEILQQLIQQIRDLLSLIRQRVTVDEGGIKESGGIGAKISGQSSLMQGAGDYSEPQGGGGEVRAEVGGTGTKKAAQLSGSERY